jgi:hypothetical protein
VPGSEGLIESDEEALIVSKQVGFPLMIKATAGTSCAALLRTTPAHQCPTPTSPSPCPALHHPRPGHTPSSSTPVLQYSTSLCPSNATAPSLHQHQRPQRAQAAPHSSLVTASTQPRGKFLPGPCTPASKTQPHPAAQLIAWAASRLLRLATPPARQLPRAAGGLQPAPSRRLPASLPGMPVLCPPRLLRRPGIVRVCCWAVLHALLHSFPSSSCPAPAPRAALRPMTQAQAVAAQALAPARGVHHPPVARLGLCPALWRPS